MFLGKQIVKPNPNLVMRPTTSIFSKMTQTQNPVSLF